MKLRHEIKHEINYSDMLILRQRLSPIMKNDEHSVDGRYEIRSIYFDTPENKALREKIDGVNFREKFRIRFYNGDKSFIVLEKKSKINGLCNKVSERISLNEVEDILKGNLNSLKEKTDKPLHTELYSKMQSVGLKPKIAVDYTREAFIFPPGNVRVTFDYNIRTSYTDFLKLNSLTIPTDENKIILEVKWDEFLPDIIRDAVNITGRRETAFSKYAICRIYG